MSSSVNDVIALRSVKGLKTLIYRKCKLHVTESLSFAAADSHESGGEKQFRKELVTTYVNFKFITRKDIEQTVFLYPKEVTKITNACFYLYMFAFSPKWLRPPFWLKWIVLCVG